MPLRALGRVIGRVVVRSFARAGAAGAFVLSAALAPLGADELATDGARFLCDRAKRAETGSLAIFAIKDARAGETPRTRQLTTRLFAGLAACGLTVVDQSKIKDVLREQVRRQSGLYDDDTPRTIGRLVAAGVLVYAELDEESLGIRMVRVADGSLLAATVIETAKAAPPRLTALEESSDVRENEPKQDENQERDGLVQWLDALREVDPELFFYATASREEFNAFVESEPVEAGRLLDRVEAMPPAALAKINRMKQSVHRLRASDPRRVQRWTRLSADTRGRMRRQAARRDRKRSPAIQRLRRPGPAARRPASSVPSAKAPARASRPNTERTRRNGAAGRGGRK